MKELNVFVAVIALAVGTAFADLSIEHESVVAGLAAAAEYPLATEEIHIRDPFVVAEGDTYFLYAAKSGPADAGVDVLESRDLRRWTERKPAMTVDSSLGCIKVWAPEVHRYHNKWYLLVTLTRQDDCQKVEPMPKSGCMLGQIQPRGMWVYVGNSPRGPFRPVTNCCLTPPEWMCLDGTLFIEDGKPYMVFCHEWCQVGDGRMMLVELSEDLSSFAGEPKELFIASSVGTGWHVTDGPCLYRSEISKRLFMFWSNFGTDGYSVYVKESSSGSVKGPWINRGKLFGKDGGHGMVFKNVEGRLHFVLHQPNKPGGKERMKMFALVDDGNVPHLTHETDLTNGLVASGQTVDNVAAHEQLATSFVGRALGCSRKNSSRVGSLDASAWKCSQWLSAKDALVYDGPVRGGMNCAPGTSWFMSEVANAGEVKSVRWMTAGLGVYEVYVNGQPVGTDFLKPGFTHRLKTRAKSAWHE